MDVKILISVIFAFLMVSAMAYKTMNNRDGSVAAVIPRSAAPRELFTRDVLLPVSSSEGLRSNGWDQLASDDAALTQLSFSPSGKFGCLAAEEGLIYVTNDGGKTWKQTKSGPSSHYYYGAQAFSDDRTCFVSGFSDPPQSGIYTYTKDGGKTWSADQSYLSADWLLQVEFSQPSLSNGIIVAISGKRFVVVTRDAKSNSFSFKTVLTPTSPSPGWFAEYPFPFVGTSANITGVNWCSTTNAGASWACKPGVDPSGDGGLYQNGTFALVGGGDISPSVTGWLHVSTNGGQTWGSRVTFPWPIRTVTCLRANLCLASGGNYFTKVGGVYLSRDGGKTWAQDFNAGIELTGVAVVGGSVYVAGSAASVGGKIYRKTYF